MRQILRHSIGAGFSCANLIKEKCFRLNVSPMVFGSRRRALRVWRLGIIGKHRHIVRRKTSQETPFRGCTRHKSKLIVAGWGHINDFVTSHLRRLIRRNCVSRGPLRCAVRSAGGKQGRGRGLRCDWCCSFRALSGGHAVY